MKVRKSKALLRSILIFGLLFAMTSVAFAEEDAALLRDGGVEEVNDAYEFTIDTEQDAVGASAGISSGGWSSLGSKLSYMEFPEGMVTFDGEKGVWCYCIDITTSTENGHKYSVATLDAAEYYEDEVSDKIRAILLNTYPHISVAELEEKLGLEGLTEEEAFIATQWILWYYSNPDGLVEAGGGAYYPANIYKPSDYPGETISMWYDDEEGNEVYAPSANVVKLAKALDALEPAGAYETKPVEIAVEQRIYDDKVVFDFGGTENLEALKNLRISVKDENGEEVPFTLSENKIVVHRVNLFDSEHVAELTVTIKAEQALAEDVYFFSPEGGRSASQSRVAVFSGAAPISMSIKFAPSKAGFDDADADAQLKVTKTVLLNGEAHRSEDIYYVALFEEAACTLPAFNGDVREIRMGGESIGFVIFDELVPGKTYYVAETDANGKALKDGDMGIETIAYDRQEVTVESGSIAEVSISNCYVEETGGGLGDGDGEDPQKDEVADPAVKTGDDANVMYLMLMAILITLSLIGMVAVLLTRKKRLFAS